MEVLTIWEAPAGTVLVFTCTDGAIQVVTDPGYTHADWLAACMELARLGTGPYSLSAGPVWEGEHDIWTVDRKVLAAA